MPVTFMTFQTETSHETSFTPQYGKNTMSCGISLESLCYYIIGLNKSIKSVAVINNRGRIIEKTSRSEFAEQFPDHLSELFCMSCTLQMSLGKDFDEIYGPINYHLSERVDLTMITIALDENIILVTTDKNISPMTLARKIVNLTSEYRKQF